MNIQVVFAVETIERSELKLGVDIDGCKGRDGIGSIAQSQPIAVSPGDGPLTRARRVQETINTFGVQVAKARIPGKDGITRIAAFVYGAPDAAWNEKVLRVELGR